MGRKVKSNKQEFGAYKGWEKQYLKKAKKYGHLEAPTKRDNKRG